MVETGSAREVHHFALLAGYGAEAVHPYLALETLARAGAVRCRKMSPTRRSSNYIKAIGKGLMKVMSKMGISTYMSYYGAQIFEAVGLNKSLVDKYFTGTASNIEGIGLFEVAEEALRLHQLRLRRRPGAGDDARRRRRIRLPRARRRPPVDAGRDRQAAALDPRQQASPPIRNTRSSSTTRRKRHMTLRGLFEFKFDQRKPIPLEEVEPAKEIVKRFATGAMSLGSISTEAHTTLAIAMNRIGGKSNTGEGGEDPAPLRARSRRARRCTRDSGKTASRSTSRSQKAIRCKLEDQAGRLGPLRRHRRVPARAPSRSRSRWRRAPSPAKAASCPGHKVSEYIAELRYSMPGVELISPPPHHDIYSIEDLAQLIHDLKNANPQASISVKLVSEVGVGTVAAGVSKAQGRPRHHRRPRRRHRRLAAVVDQARRHARGSWASPKRNRRWC